MWKDVNDRDTHIKWMRKRENIQRERIHRVLNIAEKCDYNEINDHIAALLKHPENGAILVDAHTERQAACLGRIQATIDQRGPQGCCAVIRCISILLRDFQDGAQ